MESKTVDIVYPLAEGLSHFRNQELKYSLRSVEKYVTGFRNIYLIGFKPPFINDKIIHVMQEDHPYHCKERRIMEKFLFACSIPGISDKFLMFNDDYFFTKPVDATKIPFYNKGNLYNSFIKRKPGNLYRQSLENTYNALTEKEFETRHFDVHYPMYYDKKKFPEVMAMYDWNIRAGYVVKSLYANSLKIKGAYRADCKIQKSHDKKEVLERIKDTDMFSTAEISRAIITILNDFYPDKCSYEV
jgi:hypothetical protein